MDKEMYKRILCVLLALQMLCTPIAHAQTSEPPQPEQRLINKPYGGVRGGYGLSIHQDLDQNGKKDQRYFAVERADGANQAIFDQGVNSQITAVGDNWRIDPNLPQAGSEASQTGRLPDMEFGGWYTYSPQNDFAPVKSYFNEATKMLDRQLTPGMDITLSAVGVPTAPMLYVVGHWVPSTDARGTAAGFHPVTDAKADGEAAPLSIYTTPLAGVTAAALDVLSPVIFTPDVTEYYLRVPAEVETINLSFATKEPFAAFAKQYKDAGNVVLDPTTSPVRVLVTTGDDSLKMGTQTEYTSGLKYEIQNGGTVETSEFGDTWAPNNTYENPAHALWATGEGIPLTPSAGEGQYYNTIQIKVTAPDGETERTYTFRIQRLTDPVMKLAPGNTPAGMIERDTGHVWAAEGERSKAAARDYFAKNRTFRFADGLHPSDAANQNGRIYRGNYFNLAWPTTDYDCDPKAAVAYQDRDFIEPGLTLTDSEGNPVVFGAGENVEAGYAQAVKRSYSLSVADSLTPDGVVGEGTASYTDFVPVADAEGKDPVILAKILARVGVYDIRYTFADPISGLEYDSEGTGLFQKELKEGFHRPLVVLPTPGDVDMDGAVTAADAAALKALLKPGGLTSLAAGDERVALYLYRVCDVDANGQINTGDVEKLRSGYQPRLSNSVTNASDYFYLPLPGGTEPARLAAPTGEEPPEELKAKVALDYLGKNNESVTMLESIDSGPTQNVTMDKEGGLTLNNVFWVGVRLEDATRAALFGQEFSSFTGTITYDAKYVRPVAVLSDADKAEMTKAGQSGAEAEWMWSTRKYNVGTFSDTLWSRKGYTLSKNTLADQEYTAHYSKALTTLSRGSTDGLREVVFSVDAETPAAFSGEGKGYLFLVPFQLISHPYGETEGRFLELGMGMRDMVFTGKPINVRAAGAEVATAWSMQETIFGNATQNAQGSIQYRKGSGMALKLGKDTTEYVTLYNGNEEKVNAVYGEPFTNSNVVGFNVEHTQMPAGLTYTGATATISGIPEEAGNHTFYVGGIPYQIIVEKAPLTVTATDKSKYYGEEIYCGAKNQDLSFTYDTTQIKPLDLVSGKPNTGGTAAELEGLLASAGTYVPPSRTAYLSLEASPRVPVSAGTEVGKYPILIEGASSDNYEFHYVNGTLAVLPRPVVVAGLTAGSVGTVYHDGTGVLENLPATSVKSAGGESPDSTEQPGFTVSRAPGLPTDDERYYDGRVLSSFGLWGEDELAIIYNAEFLQNQGDKDNQAASGNRFTVVHGATERRDVTVSKVRMTDTERARNYTLKSETPLTPKLEKGGQVTERTLEKLEIIGFPEAVRSYTYGQTLNISGSLVVKLTHGKGQDVKPESVAYSVDGFKQKGLNLSWVSREEMDAGEVGRDTPATHGQQLHVKEHSGKHLCVWTEWVEGGTTITLAAYSRDVNPSASVTVYPRPLTLTVENQERYYGEPNAAPVFRYDITELAGWDKKAGVIGKMEELDAGGKVALRDYTRPTMVIHETLLGNREVDARTTANSDMPRYIKIYGGAASDYTFRFVKNDGSEKPPTAPEEGYGTLYIHPRPIIVETVDQAPVGTIYADTATPGLTGLKLVRGKPNAADTFTAVLPQREYYLPGSGMEPTPMPEGMELTGQAILAEDTVGLIYNADFLRDNQKVPYFAMGAAGEKEYPVIVKGLTLDEDYGAKNNYRLVYKNVGDASFGYPSTRKNTDYTSAVGTVRVRPIVRIELTKEPSILALTYGDELFPEGMELRISYEDKYENDPVGNAKKLTERVRYTQSGFEARGLRTYYMDGQAISAEPLAFTGEYPVVAKTGQRLTVQGQIPYAVSDDDPNQLAAVVRAENNTGTLTIRKKPLTLTVGKQFRFYGEGNREYTFTAQRSALAAPELAAKDQAGQPLFPEMKPVLTGKSSATGPVVAVGETDLAKLDGYSGLKFSTSAVPGSPVRDGGYDLTLVGGVAHNYVFEYKKATIGVLKRPIVVTKVTGEGDSWTTPRPEKYIYTVYPTGDDPTRRTYPTTVTQAGFTAGDAATHATGAYPAGTYWDEEVRALTASDEEIPMTVGGLRNGDGARLSLTVVFDPFPTEKDFKENEIEIPWEQVTIRDISLGTEAEKNYRLVFPGAAGDDKAPTSPAAIAKVDRRDIDFIEVIKAPVLGDYIYGQPLDLTDLTLRITYKKHDTEAAAKVDEVPYGQRANIYVNYWPANATGDGPAALPDTAADWQTLGEHYRAADTGDHLTIAPVHDDPTFAANGKYLVISARTHENMAFVEPRQVATAETGVNPIRVAPLQLTYTLTAEGKTYDGTTAAEGAIELTNAYNKDSVTDVVYVATGAEYEDKGSTAGLYSGFLEYIKNGGNKYIFPAKDTEKLNFLFIHPNVRYEDERHTTVNPVPLDDGYWDSEQKNPDGHGYGPVANMPVEVRNINLAGPDAANYTWKSGETLHQIEVLRTTRNEAEDNQAAAPYATIEKARYAMPDPAQGRPTVEVDRHTNAVRVQMRQPLPVDENDQYGTELHYEYALETLAKTDGAEIAYQLGDKDAYQDTTFFGGEPVVVLPPEGYESTEPPKEPGKDDIIKGQIYLWAEDDRGFGLDDRGAPLRTPVPRGSYLWGRVRLAETHNFLPSAPLYTIEDDAPELGDTALTQAIADAEERAQAESDSMTEPKGSASDKEDKDPAPVEVPAGKSYAQRLDLVSTEQKRGEDTKDYQVNTLESVWFTDVLLYEKKEVLDAVTRNSNPTRYYGYFWDVDHSAALVFDKEPLDLSGPITDIEITKKGENGTTEKDTITVNENQIASLFVSTTTGEGGARERAIEIRPGFLDRPLNADRVELTVRFTPSYTSNRKITWASSNEKVAAVSAKGVVTFTGVGEAVITATSRYKKTDSITVRVSDPKYWVDPEAGRFGFYKTEPFFTLDSNGRFYPDHAMTRGELAAVLASFLTEDGELPVVGTGLFPDVSPDAPYAAAVEKLGGLGVINGIKNVGFAAERTATRAEFFVMLARMMGVEISAAKGGPHAFKDSGEKECWAWATIDAMAALGIAKGTGGGNFSPERPITRAEVATLLARLLRFQERSADWQSTAPTDVAPGNWAYDAVLRAVNGLQGPETEKKTK